MKIRELVRPAYEGIRDYGDGYYHLTISLVVMASASMWGTEWETAAWLLVGACTALALKTFRDVVLAETVAEKDGAVCECVRTTGRLGGIALITGARGPLSFYLAGNSDPVNSDIYPYIGAAALAYLLFASWQIHVRRKREKKDKG